MESAWSSDGWLAGWWAGRLADRWAGRQPGGAGGAGGAGGWQASGRSTVMSGGSKKEGGQKAPDTAIHPASQPAGPQTREMGCGGRKILQAKLDKLNKLN
ncbi:unnamed protein product [[Candida] boidinii]|uniref:Unnamed protein product n=1 Tax=Candida boidinii TaxID=5477 RepID=A0ACB5TW25_CANBO|nr:unnamed protein product [[Candida] boidinii]